MDREQYREGDDREGANDSVVKAVENAVLGTIESMNTNFNCKDRMEIFIDPDDCEESESNKQQFFCWNRTKWRNSNGTSSSTRGARVRFLNLRRLFNSAMEGGAKRKRQAARKDSIVGTGCLCDPEWEDDDGNTYQHCDTSAPCTTGSIGAW